MSRSDVLVLFNFQYLMGNLIRNNASPDVLSSETRVIYNVYGYPKAALKRDHIPIRRQRDYDGQNALRGTIWV